MWTQKAYFRPLDWGKFKCYGTRIVQMGIQHSGNALGKAPFKMTVALWANSFFFLLWHWGTWLTCTEAWTRPWTRSWVNSLPLLMQCFDWRWANTSRFWHYNRTQHPHNILLIKCYMKSYTWPNLLCRIITHHMFCTWLILQKTSQWWITKRHKVKKKKKKNRPKINPEYPEENSDLLTGQESNQWQHRQL